MNDLSDEQTILSLDGCAVRTVDTGKVVAVRAAMPPDSDIVEVADVFALLGDPNRLRLLIALLEGGEMCVCDLAATAGMSESAASHAVRWLRAHKRSRFLFTAPPLRLPGAVGSPATPIATV